MPLDTLTPRSLSMPHRPKYLQLSDAIADLIDSGYLMERENLPAEGRIAEMVGTSKAVVRAAMAELERDSLIERRNGVPARVAPRGHVRIINDERYRQEDRLIEAGIEAPNSAFTRAYGIPWGQYRIELEIKKEAATPKDREYLLLHGKDVMVWRRKFVKFDQADKPVELQRSAIPLDVAVKCPWMIDRGTQPYPGGTQRELADGGLRVTSVQHKMKARNPTENEKGDLQIAEVPVLDIVRVFLSGGKRVECSRVIVNAARHEIDYETTL